MLPLVGESRRPTQRAIVDLPEPDSPTTASVSPGATVKLIRSTALNGSADERQAPRRSANSLTRSVTTTSSLTPPASMVLGRGRDPLARPASLQPPLPQRSPALDRGPRRAWPARR